MWRALATALILSFLLAGCGGSKGTANGTTNVTTLGPTTAAQQTPAGWTSHHVSDGAFTVAVPSTWKTTSGVDRKSIDRFFADNPQFAQFRSTLSNGLIKLFAADPKLDKGFATNLNVLVQDLGREMSVEDYAHGTSAELTRQTGVHPDTAFVDLPAGRAARFTYEFSGFRILGKATKLALLQYALVHDKTAYVLTFTTRPDVQQRYRSTFEQAARSFRFD